MEDENRKRIKLNMLRKAMIKNFEKSINVAAQSTVAIEIEMSNINLVKATLQEKIFKKKQTKLTYLPLFIYIISRVLKWHPFMNSKLDMLKSEIILEKDINIGFAVSIERGDLPGILLPIIRNADNINLCKLVRTIRDLSDKAMKGIISIEEMTGGTFSISSVGKYKVDFIQPLLNYPEGAILGITKVKEKPITKEGKICIAPVSNFCITVDHRIIDGVSTYNFLEDLKKAIEKVQIDYFNVDS